MLNYLYALLESESRLTLAALGLDPGIGILHKDTRTRDSLASDLMEPVRAQVDAYLLDWLTKEPLRRQWFLEERNGNCRLVSSLASRLSETCEIWRRAVAPFAEGIARALYSKRSATERGPATRLTQERKREAKGIVGDIPMPKIPKSSSTCRLCGTEIKHKQKYCRQCAPGVVKENVLKAAVLGRQNTHSLQAQAKRSKTQRRQSAALKAWNSKNKPEWLDESFFKKQVQPRLITVMVPKIMEALSVSEPYALSIRSGKRTPHPRHWLTLAKLGRVQRLVPPVPGRGSTPGGSTTPGGW
jgi:CRISPR associated protein Cas1